jgi:two-component system heavy metal sensor histidine kinase CusS
MKSFRWRLALSLSALAGLTLLAFGVSAYFLVRNAKLERIDSSLRVQAEREAGRIPHPRGGNGVEANIALGLGAREPADLAYLLQDADGETLYLSAHWPAALEVATLPWPPLANSNISRTNAFEFISTAHAAESLPPLERPWRPHPPRRDQANWPPRAQLPPPQQRPQQRQDGLVDNRSPPVLNNEDTAESAVALPEPPGRENLRQVLPETPTERRPQPPVSTLLERKIGDQKWHVVLARSDRARAALAVNLRVLDSEMASIRNAFFIAIPLALLLIGMGGWALSGQILRPLKKLTVAARRVTADGLDKRISPAGEDHEFVELIEVFNRMLGRLERSFKQSQRFSADAAHELKTPLAILQGQLERAINNADAGSSSQAELSGILDEVQRLATISRKLLLLSQADAGRLAVHRESFALSEFLLSLVEDVQMLAPGLNVAARISQEILIEADASLLKQLLHNLVSNAIKYNIEQGWIRIAAEAHGDRVEMVVSNPCNGIAPHQREHMFERFYRADTAHSRTVEGVGLGLALSREIARAHQGELSFEIDDEDTVRFRLVLPQR